MFTGIRKRLSTPKASTPPSNSTENETSTPPSNSLRSSTSERSLRKSLSFRRARANSTSLLTKLSSPWKNKPKFQGNVPTVGKQTASSSEEESKLSDEESKLSDEESDHQYYNRLYSFYQEHNPEKLDEIEDVLERYEGNEEALFMRLNEKYVNATTQRLKERDFSHSDGDESERYDDSFVSNDALDRDKVKDSGFQDEHEFYVEELSLMKEGNVVKLGVRYAGRLTALVIELRYFGVNELDVVVNELFELPNGVVNFGQLSRDRVINVLQVLLSDGKEKQHITVVAYELDEKEAEKDQIEAEENNDWLWKERLFEEQQSKAQEEEVREETETEEQSMEVEEAEMDDKVRQVDLNISYRIRDELESKSAWTTRVNLLDSAVVELIQTEESYCHDLTAIHELVLAPMATSGKLSSKARKTLPEFFEHWKELAEFHTKFYAKLQLACLRNSTTEVCKSLLLPNALGGSLQALDKLCPFFTVYKSYCVDYSQALEVYVEEVQTNKVLKKFIEEQCVGVLRGCALEPHLIKPIQRICKYPLLIRAITKGLPEELSVVQEALEYVKSVVKKFEELVHSVDHAKLDADRLAEMVRIHNRLRWGREEKSISLMEPHRQLLRMKELNVKRSSDEDGVYHCRFVILCNDLVLMTVVRKSWLNSTKKIYHVFETLPLDDLHVDQLEPEESVEQVNTEMSTELSSSSWNDTWIIGFKTVTELKEWKEDLRVAATFSSNSRKSSVLLEELARIEATEQAQSTFIKEMTRVKHRVVSVTKTVFGTLHHDSAVIIQKSYRGVLGRRNFQHKREEHKRRSAGALTIQKAFRRFRSSE